MSAVQSGNKPSGIFDLGGILGSVVDTGLSTFEEIAPVWASEQLGLQSRDNSTDRATFQEGGKDTVRDGVTLTTGDGQAAGSVVTLSTNMILLGAGVLLLGFVMLKDN